jgi:hypothetical protein
MNQAKIAELKQTILCPIRKGLVDNLLSGQPSTVPISCDEDFDNRFEKYWS